MQAILFDLGNVLIPYNHQQMLTAVASLLGEMPEVVHTRFTPIAHDLGLGRVAPEELCRVMLADVRVASITCEQVYAAFCTGLSRDESALAYAVALQERPGVTVGVISNTNAIHVAWLDAHVPELDALDLVIMSNEVELRKPDPEIFTLALELLEVSPAQVLFVDDLPGNVDAAIALGMSGIVHRSWLETRPQIEQWLKNGA